MWWMIIICVIWDTCTQDRNKRCKASRGVWQMAAGQIVQLIKQQWSKDIQATCCSIITWTFASHVCRYHTWSVEKSLYWVNKSDKIIIQSSIIVLGSKRKKGKKKELKVNLKIIRERKKKRREDIVQTKLYLKLP